MPTEKADSWIKWLNLKEYSGKEELTSAKAWASNCLIRLINAWKGTSSRLRAALKEKHKYENYLRRGLSSCWSRGEGQHSIRATKCRNLSKIWWLYLPIRLILPFVKKSGCQKSWANYLRILEEIRLTLAFGRRTDLRSNPERLLLSKYLWSPWFVVTFSLLRLRRAESPDPVKRREQSNQVSA